MGNPYKKLGEKLKEKRKQKGYSQTEFGDRINHTQDAVSRFESGDRRMDAIALFSACDELDCSADELNPFDYDC